MLKVHCADFIYLRKKAWDLLYYKESSNRVIKRYNPANSLNPINPHSDNAAER
jgi:hypothetical protein